jgi:hypothetical protein
LFFVTPPPPPMLILSPLPASIRQLISRPAAGEDLADMPLNALRPLFSMRTAVV